MKYVVEFKTTDMRFPYSYDVYNTKEDAIAEMENNIKATTNRITDKIYCINGCNTGMDFVQYMSDIVEPNGHVHHNYYIWSIDEVKEMNTYHIKQVKTYETEFVCKANSKTEAINMIHNNGINDYSLDGENLVDEHYDIEEV